VRVETLARELGVSKGGFYWQFEDRGSLLGEMLDAFEREGVDKVIELVERDGGDARRRLRRLLEHAMGPKQTKWIGIELAVRDWARRDKTVAKRLRRVDNRRIDYLRSLFHEICRDADEAEARSMLVACLFIGPSFMRADYGERTERDVVLLAADWLLR
jgi:AcrR family transcriptional regulator